VRPSTAPNNSLMLTRRAGSWLELAWPAGRASSRGRLPASAGQHSSRPLGELMGDPDPEKSKRVTADAMLKMQKIIVADLQKAYDG